MNYKNICLTITNLANGGGEERMCAILANALAKEGHNVIIVSTDKPYGAQVQFEVSPCIRCYSLKGCRVERRLSRMPLFHNYDIWKYRAILKRHKIQLVIDVDVHLSLITTRAVKRGKVKVISWDHFNYERFLAKPSRVPLRECFRHKIDKLVVLTKYDQQAYTEKEGLPTSLIAQIYNPSPIECDTFTPHHTHKVLAMGRLAEQKGFDILLDVWAQVEQKAEDWELEIVGDGPDLESLQVKTKALQLRHITFSPFTKDVRQKYADASIFVLSSRYEGFGLVLVEAMSMSLPLVSFNCVAGPSEIIEDGKNGFLVPMGDTTKMADCILKLIDDNTLRESMSRTGYEMAKQYRMENILQHWNELINTL